jgi:phage N-6-adenine-methyltransferase
MRYAVPDALAKTIREEMSTIDGLDGSALEQAVKLARESASDDDRSTDPLKVGPSDISGEERDGSETPQWLFDLIDTLVEEITGHRFELDAAASDWNHKCSNYFDEATDALAQDWSAHRTVWCNPPFSASLIERFVRKAIEAANSGSTVVLLLPIWPGYDWYQEIKRSGQLRDVIGPVRFQHHDGGHALLNNGRYSVSLVVAILGPHVAAGTNGPPIRRAGGLDPPPETPGPGHSPRSARHQAKLITLSELTPVATPEGVVKVEWRGECDYGPDDLLSPSKPDPQSRSEVGSAEDVTAPRQPEPVTEALPTSSASAPPPEANPLDPVPSVESAIPEPDLTWRKAGKKIWAARTDDESRTFQIEQLKGKNYMLSVLLEDAAGTIEPIGTYASLPEAKDCARETLKSLRGSQPSVPNDEEPDRQPPEEEWNWLKQTTRASSWNHIEEGVWVRIGGDPGFQLEVDYDTKSEIFGYVVEEACFYPFCITETLEEAFDLVEMEGGSASRDMARIPNSRRAIERTQSCPDHVTPEMST